jgi:hypothetical protein
MKVEFLDGYGLWQPLENASAVRVAPGEYEVTISQLSPAWQVSRDLFDGAKIRVNGRETKTVVGTRRDRDRLILLATARERTPAPNR